MREVIQALENSHRPLVCGHVNPDPDCIVSGKSIMGLMMLGAGEGTRIEISVAGTDTASETLARWLYGIPTSRSYFDLKPDRFVTPSSDEAHGTSARQAK